MVDLPTFDVAQHQLVAFLGRASATCADVCWVFREDFYGPDRHHIIVPRHVPSSNSTLARRTYDHGARAGHGVNVHAEFVHDGRAYCWVDVPRDETDAQNRMISGLKVSRREPLPSVVQVGAASWLCRRIASQAYRRHVRLYEVAPLRATVVA